jgi:hypothetical protein
VTIPNHLAEVRRIEEQPHQHTAESSSDRDRHNPCGDEQADTLPVNGTPGAVAKADADSSTSDAHGCRDGQGELREDEDGDGRAHFHGAAAGGRVVGDFVAHDCELSLVCFRCGYMLDGRLPFMML